MSYSSTLQRTETALTRLIEAAKRTKTEKALEKPVAILETALGKLFIKQGNAIVRALDPLRVFIKEASINQQFDNIFDAATEETSLQMLATLEKAFKSTLLLGAQNQLAETGIKISFKLDNPRANAYIAAYGADQITGIDDTTREDIRSLLLAGIENGDSFNRIAQSIKARYVYFAEGKPQEHIRSRAHLIAITETGNAYQAGNFASIQAAQDTGIKMLKRWLTIGDGRVSDGCIENAAQDWIPINQTHQSGHMHPLRFPGCRCVEQYKRDKESAATVAKTVADRQASQSITPVPNASAFDARTFKTGTEADKYYAKNSPITNKDLDFFEHSALQSYQHEGYKSINGGLRSGDKKLQREWSNEIKQLDKVFKRTVTTEDILAHRGLIVTPGSPAETLLNSWQVDGIYKEPGYMSTTVDKNRVTKFLSSVAYGKKQPKGTQQVFIEIRVPKGTPAVYMNGCVEQRGITNYKEERELLIKRDQQYRIVSKETDAKGNVHIVMELI